jgi:tetratricopeptide (TPR) repeat protein
MVAKIDDLASFGLTLLDAESGASLGLLATAADRGGARPVVDAALPERLGRYHVLERLGAGGMGVVVAAYDPELDRKVAIKLIHAGRDDEEARARLLREAQAMARLAHPNVVAVHDVGVFAGQVFVAMEFVRGETLGGWLQRQPRSWSEVLAVFVSAGRGLAAAHEAGLVHRDFKPDNVLISAAGRVQVTDFGLARSELAEASDRPVAALGPGSAVLTGPLTQVGALVGTPAYMAAEQHMGAGVDARTDQYAFCASLYQGLFGVLPFAGTTLTALAQAVMLGQVREPPRGRRVPAWLLRAVLRGLRPDPAQRWPSMQALLVVLGRDPARARRRGALIAALGLGAVLGGLGYQRDVAGRCTGAAAELAGVWDPERQAAARSALLATGVSYAGESWERVQEKLERYATTWVALRTVVCVAHRDGATSDAALDRQVGCLARRRDDLAALMAVLVSADRGVAERAVTAAAELPELRACTDLTALGSEVPPPPPEHARAAQALRAGLARARADRSAGRFQEAEAVAEATLATPAAAADPALRAAARLELGLARAKLGAHAEAEVSLRAAWLAGLAGHDDAVAARAAIELVTVVGRLLARPDDGLRWADDARAMLTRRGGDAGLTARLAAGLGALYARAGRYQEAETAVREAVGLREAGGAAADPGELAAVLTALGDVLRHEGRYAEAEASLARAVALQVATLGPEHPAVATARNNLGNALSWQGKVEEALTQHELAAAIRARALGPEHPDVASSRTNLAVALLLQGRYAEAEAQLHRAVAIRERAQGPAHPDLADPITDLGGVYFAQRRFAAAVVQYRRALAIDEAALGPQHPGTASARSNLGTALWRMGRLGEAEVELSVALATMQQALGEAHAEVGAPMLSLGEVALARGQLGVARTRLEAALKIATAGAWPAGELARVRFALARARAAQGEDTRAEVQAAADAFVAAGQHYAAEAAEARSWRPDIDRSDGSHVVGR